MKKKYAICYVSHVAKNVSEENIEQLLQKSQISNMKKNITGVLLYSEGNFFQVLEGEESVVKSLFTKIEEDDRHTAIFKIFGKQIEIYKYDGYQSDFVSNANKIKESTTEYMAHVTTKDFQTRAVIENMLKVFIAS